MNLWKVFTRGIIEENPYFVLALSLCPGLAVTTSVINGLTMALTRGFAGLEERVVRKPTPPSFTSYFRMPSLAMIAR